MGRNENQTGRVRRMFSSFPLRHGLSSDWQKQPAYDTGAGPRFAFETSADFFEALTHIGEAVAGRSAVIHYKPAPVVFDNEGNASGWIEPNPKPDFRGVGMFGDIVHRL